MARTKRRKLVATDNVAGFSLEKTPSNSPPPPPPAKRGPKRLVATGQEIIDRENADKKARRKAIAAGSGSEMKKKFLEMFVEKFGVKHLKERWPDGEIDTNFFSWFDMRDITMDRGTDEIWKRVRWAAIAHECPPTTVPPTWMVYDLKNEAQLTEEKKPINPMELTKAKARATLQDCIDMMYDLKGGKKLDGAIVNYLRAQAISPMIASMMLNSFMADFEPDEKFPEKFPGEYSLAKQAKKCRVLGEQLKQFAEEARNQKKSKTSKRITKKRKGVKLGQIEKALATFKYEKLNDKHKISSVDPERIFGASSVLLYSTKYGRVTLLEAVPLGVLGLKGSSVVGFDKTTALEKACRDPKKFLDWSTKAKSRRSVKKLKGKEYTGNGRSNAQTIILAVFK
jgi:hypothetical protein